jgi:hypothetical protein
MKIFSLSYVPLGHIDFFLSFRTIRNQFFEGHFFKKNWLLELFFCNFNYFCAVLLVQTFTVLVVELKEDGVEVVKLSYLMFLCQSLLYVVIP